MDYIQTKSPLLIADLAALATRMRSVSSTSFDGVVLSNLAWTCYECALRKSELINMSIGDVASKAVVGVRMRIDGGDKKDKLLPLSNSAKQVLQDHMQHLEQSGYKRYPSSPLFPTKRKTRYPERSLQNHWKNICDACGTEISLEEVRQGGICSYYDFLKANGLSPRDCLKNTAEYARISERHAADLLGDQIQPTGNKPNALYDHLEEIEKFEMDSEKTGINCKEAIRILKKIRRDSELDADEKKALGSTLVKFLKEFKPKSNQNSAPVEEPTHSSLSERIREFIATSKYQEKIFIDFDDTAAFLATEEPKTTKEE
jgi:hypothetical protein